MKSVRRRLDKLERFSTQDLRLLCQAMLWVVAVRVALWLLPYRLVRRSIPETLHADCRHRSDRSTRIFKARRIARMVRISSRCVPKASCLTQALSAQGMLHQQDVETTLRIGVGRHPASREFRAHAWLECDGEVILGGDVMSDFTAFDHLAASR